MYQQKKALRWTVFGFFMAFFLGGVCMLLHAWCPAGDPNTPGFWERYNKLKKDGAYDKYGVWYNYNKPKEEPKKEEPKKEPEKKPDTNTGQIQKQPDPPKEETTKKDDPKKEPEIAKTPDTPGQIQKQPDLPKEKTTQKEEPNKELDKKSDTTGQVQKQPDLPKDESKKDPAPPQVTDNPGQSKQPPETPKKDPETPKATDPNVQPPANEAKQSPVSPTAIARPLRPAPGTSLEPSIFNPIQSVPMWENWWSRNRLYYLPFKEPVKWEQPSAAGPTGGDQTVGVKSQPNKELLDPLINFLAEDKSPLVRATAALALAKFQDKSVIPQLQKAFIDDNNFDVRNVSALALGILGDETSLTPFKEIMLGENAGGSKSQMITRAYVALSLGYLKNAQATEALKAALDANKDINPEIQCSALLSLGNTGDKAHIGFLSEILADTKREESVRSYAALALGHIKDPAALPALRKTLTDKNVNIRSSAVMALGMLKSPEAKSDLLNMFSTSEKSSDVRGFAALALASAYGGGATDKSIYPVLSAALTKAEPNVLHGMIVLALGILGDPRAVADLKPMAEKRTKPLSRGAAILALGLLKDKSNLPVLIKIVEKEEVSDPVAWIYAIQALGLIGDASAAPVLENAFNKFTKKIDLAQAAYNNITVALAMVGKRKEIIANLTAQLNEKSLNPELKKRALHGLGYLGDKDSIATLLKVAKEKTNNDEIRTEAVLALGFVLDKDKVNPLYRLTADNNFNVRLLIMNHINFSKPE